MKFFAMLKAHENTADKMAMGQMIQEKGGMEKAKMELPEGVKILESGRLFGTYGMAVFYEAPDEHAAIRFLSEFTPYATVERYLTAPCPLCENAKATQTTK
jgi:uncharacterized protein with GYD domain